MKKVLILLAVLAIVGSAPATVLLWAGDLLGTPGDEWSLTTPGHWTPDGTTVSTVVPGVGDHAIIYDQSYGPQPVIRTDIGVVEIVTPSWHDGTTSSLTVETGGKIDVPGFLRLGHGAGSHATLNIDGGTVVTSILQAGDNGAGTGTGVGVINLNAGMLDTGTSSFYNAVLDIELGAYFYLDNDRTGAVQTWVDDGKITAIDGTGEVMWDYSETANTTTVWATCTFYLVSDINKDCVVDVADLSILASEWLLSGL